MTVTYEKARGYLDGLAGALSAITGERDSLRAERVQLQKENESLRADLLQSRQMLASYRNEPIPDTLEGLYERYTGKAEDLTARDKTDVEVLAERLAKVEDRLADIASEALDQHRDIDRVEQSVGRAHNRIDALQPPDAGAGFPHTTLAETLTPAFGRGDEVRLDMAMSQGGMRHFGWYTVEGVATNPGGFTVQVSKTEDRDRVPKPVYWIKPEDILEVSHPATR